MCTSKSFESNLQRWFARLGNNPGSEIPLLHLFININLLFQTYGFNSCLRLPVFAHSFLIGENIGGNPVAIFPHSILFIKMYFAKIFGTYRLAVHFCFLYFNFFFEISKNFDVYTNKGYLKLRVGLWSNEPSLHWVLSGIFGPWAHMFDAAFISVHHATETKVLQSSDMPKTDLHDDWDADLEKMDSCF